MDSFLIMADGTEREVSPGTVRRLLGTSDRFWLDLAGVDRETADGLLRDTFGFHELAVGGCRALQAAAQGRHL
jgi:hypothetical protein